MAIEPGVPQVYAQGALRADQEGWVAQARSLEGVAKGWVAQARKPSLADVHPYPCGIAAPISGDLGRGGTRS